MDSNFELFFARLDYIWFDMGSFEAVTLTLSKKYTYTYSNHSWKHMGPSNGCSSRWKIQWKIKVFYAHLPIIAVRMACGAVWKLEESVQIVQTVSTALSASYHDIQHKIVSYLSFNFFSVSSTTSRTTNTCRSRGNGRKKCRRSMRTNYQCSVSLRFYRWLQVWRDNLSAEPK
jgi:hypothetical protein